MKKRFYLNTATSLLYQLVVIVCGFILPKVYLLAFGSEINGLVTSITQFLGFISLCEMGIGSVIQSSLYKPLAEKDDAGLSAVIASGAKFFSKIGLISILYIVFLLFFIPYAIDNRFDWFFTSTLIIAIGIGTFAQYFVGIIDNILLAADQRGYVQYLSQIIAIISNTILSILIISFGGSIQLVKLFSSIIFILRPLYLRFYINKNYNINRKIKYNGEPIKQKWNGLAQHIAAVILGDTDTIVLTLFSTLTNVSIYSVYFLVVNGVKTILISLCYGLQPILGELYAKKESFKLKSIFGTYEYMLHTIVVLVFSCTSVLIVPFISVYTSGINDAIYAQPLFGFIMSFAYAALCLRTPYSNMIFAAGHYKETQKSFIVAAIMNIIISVICVNKLGLVGVAIGTLISMAYQMVWMAQYCIKTFFDGSFKPFYKQIMVDILTTIIIVFATRWIGLECLNYISWIIMALKVFAISLLIVFLVNFFVYRNKCYKCIMLIKEKVKKEK